MDCGEDVVWAESETINLGSYKGSRTDEDETGMTSFDGDYPRKKARYDRDRL